MIISATPAKVGSKWLFLGLFAVFLLAWALFCSQWLLISCDWGTLLCDTEYWYWYWYSIILSLTYIHNSLCRVLSLLHTHISYPITICNRKSYTYLPVFHQNPCLLDNYQPLQAQAYLFIYIYVRRTRVHSDWEVCKVPDFVTDWPKECAFLLWFCYFVPRTKEHKYWEQCYFGVSSAVLPI